MLCPGSLPHVGEAWLESVAAWDEAQLPKDVLSKSHLVCLLSCPPSHESELGGSGIRPVVQNSALRGQREQPDNRVLCSSSFLVGGL